MDKNCVDTVIYHHPCPDGFGSALVVYLYMKKFHPEREITYLPTNYNREAPDVTGKNVIICDFSFRKPVLEQLIAEASNLLIIDHHKTAEKELAEIDQAYKIFDMEHSGCVLTWNHFFPDEEPPLLLQYIEDRDLWRKNMENSDAFVSWFYTLPFEFDVYEQFLDNFKIAEGIATRGIPYLELNRIYTKELAKRATPRLTMIKMDGKERFYFIAYMNINNPILRSDVGNEILDVYPYADFAAVYSLNDRSDTTSFSLRSAADRTDVSEVARTFGGGGHRNAAGINIPHVTNTLGRTADNGKLYKKIENIYFGEYKGLNVVYLNLSTGKYRVGQWLLQTRMIGGNLVQNGNLVDKSTEWIDVAALWDFDGHRTNFTIVFSDKKNYDAIFPEKTMSLDGMHHKL